MNISCPKFTPLHGNRISGPSPLKISFCVLQQRHELRSLTLLIGIGRRVPFTPTSINSHGHSTQSNSFVNSCCVFVATDLPVNLNSAKQARNALQHGSYKTSLSVFPSSSPVSTGKHEIRDCITL